MNNNNITLSKLYYIDEVGNRKEINNLGSVSVDISSNKSITSNISMPMHGSSSLKISFPKIKKWYWRKKGKKYKKFYKYVEPTAKDIYKRLFGVNSLEELYQPFEVPLVPSTVLKDTLKKHKKF